MLAGIGVGVLMRYWGLVNLTMPCLATLAARDGPRNAALSVGSDDDSARGTVRGERISDRWLAWRAETSWTPSNLAMGEQGSDVAHAAHTLARKSEVAPVGPSACVTWRRW